MIKLAFAIAFLSVFGVVAYFLVLLVSRILKKDENENQSNNLNNKKEEDGK